MNEKEIAICCAKIADDKKAADIIVLEMAERLPPIDYFVICSGNSERHSQTICKEIELLLKGKGISCKRIEGYQEGKWILMDYYTLVVHIYLEETRNYYELEDLWADAPQLAWETSEVLAE